MLKSLFTKVIQAAFFCCFGLLSANGQLSSQDIANNLSSDSRVSDYTMDANRGTPSIIKMNESGATLAVSEVPAFLQSVLGYGTETEFVSESITTSHGVTVEQFRQYTNGIKAEHGVIKALSRKGVVTGFAAEYYALSPSLINTPSLSEADALAAALSHIDASLYAWDYIASLGSGPDFDAAYQEAYPKGDLVLVDNYNTLEVDVSLAYKFDIYAAEPLSRDDIYVDAATGEVLLVDATIKHANGHSKDEILETVEKKRVQSTQATGDTRYAGTRNFDTSQDSNGNWVLNGFTPTGVANETRSYDGLVPDAVPLVIYTQLVTPLSVAIADGDGTVLHPEVADNIWNESEHRVDDFNTTPYPLGNEANNDDIALDAHWGAEVVLNYWEQKHGRNSYDDQGAKLFNYVHYGNAYDNAFWNGESMTYGDGSYQGGTNPDGSFAPLTSMDVCAHEIGHGICEHTSDLVYARESGAMNEGFSDIWAAAVESYVLTEIDASLEFDPWGIGEQVDERDGGLQPGDPMARALRWMDDPKAAGDPDSYGGENWINQVGCTPGLTNDQCGVHTNSGVLNKWYYLLVTGSGQSFSVGLNKSAQDDQINDAGESYAVNGLGYDRASQIAYISETLLSPNATYAEMREVSILTAQTLFGLASDEEIQTTNAWHAVNVGEAYSIGEPNTIMFSDSNPLIYSEDNDLNGCEDFNVYPVFISSVEVPSGTTVNLSTAGTTASEGYDYDISTRTLTFSGTETQRVDITVYDDADIENVETISLSYVFNGEFFKQEFSISDNDFTPRTGSSVMELLPTETFDTFGFPTGWSSVTLSEGNNMWKVNGDLTAAGRAYISDGITDIPFYDQNSPTSVMLLSPVINAKGTKDVTVSFDWEAGGERDALDHSVIYDHGELMYSLDGVWFEPVQKFVGDGVLGAETTSGTYTATLGDLDGEDFILGWKWFNDTNAGTQFSFAIDNVTVTATPLGIETQAGSTASASVNKGSVVYFMSDQDGALIGMIENTSEDLGCVTLSVTDEGSSFSVFSNISTARPSKAFGIEVENSNATYDLTMYFTDNELNAFDETIALIPIKVNSSDINDADDRARNFQLNGTVTDVNSEDMYRAYTGTFSGSGSASIVQDFAYCTDAPSPWTSADVGNVGATGSICHIDGNFELSGSGRRIGKKSDSFYFTYQQLNGDGEIIARVNSLQNTHREAKAAVMFRESLDANSKFAMTAVVANPLLTGTQAQLEYRNSTGANAKGKGYNSVQTPEFIRIVRSGNTFTSYVSDTNGNWQQIGTRSVNMGQTAYVGLAVTSHSYGALSTAEFSDVQVTQTAQSASARRAESAKPANTSTYDYTMYPNPATNSIQVRNAGATLRSIEIYSLSGMLMKQVLPEQMSVITIDIASLPKGIYVMRMIPQDGEVVTNKFVKE
ncbi:Por secretion system C-terminal sorting domain-containing protein [Ekhidna lutea]|uniref:Por secretion system C-terminal sorting domain-containing protein n=1 Tax=Ekhidna lutea TaxID=447679 RepID=A0A239HT17_EKHLU|nr:M4 family metallopeptidase [Ekhidna lutea]SNS84335.1 Por secretion system C-terminal sorting domain-containing protein [Ekhidna lutea]